MLHAFIHHLEGSLLQAVRKRKHPGHLEREEPKRYPAMTTLLTEKTRQSVGAIRGQMPALASRDRNKPYSKALRGLAGLQNEPHCEAKRHLFYAWNTVWLAH